VSFGVEEVGRAQMLVALLLIGVYGGGLGGAPGTGGLEVLADFDRPLELAEPSFPIGREPKI
jgi:hypothetical protein